MAALTHCPVCDSSRLLEVLSREGVPVHQNAVMLNVRAAEQMVRGELRLACCKACGFLFNRSFHLNKLAYGANYDNVQTHSGIFRGYVNELADHLVDSCGVRGCRVVEVGCGDGYFLRRLVEAPAAGNTGIGFDPSYSGPDLSETEGLRIERRYYDADCADIDADVVVSRHVIEHVPDPVAMLDAVRLALRKSPQARVYFETPCVEWILRGNVVWDVFYEHCSYFSARSLTTAFERAGFRIDRINHIFGGQYLWLEGRIATKRGAVTMDPGQVPELAASFATNEEQMLASLGMRFSELAQRKKLAIWGAGAKGTTLANLLDAEARLFDCVIDINPNKQGCFVGGSGHSIVSLEQAQARGVSAAVLMNPNYRDEAESMVVASGTPLELLETI